MPECPRLEGWFLQHPISGVLVSPVECLVLDQLEIQRRYPLQDGLQVFALLAISKPFNRFPGLTNCQRRVFEAALYRMRYLDLSGL